MRRLLAISLFIGAICFSTWTRSSFKAMAAGSTGGDAAALQSDESLQQAFAKQNTKAAAALLDQEFTWTNETGQTMKRAEFLHEMAAGAAGSGTEYTDVKARDYGQLAIITGTGVRQGKPRTFFARIWVKRQPGWLLLVHQDTAVLAQGSSNQQAPPPASAAKDSTDCENPCRTVPYAAKTADQGEVVKAYQAVETAVTSHDAPTWAYHVADEFVGIGRRYFGTPDTKQGRVGQIGIVSNRVVLPKMLWLQVFVFGDSAIMIADHQPVGEKPYHVIRVWVNRDGRWQLFHRQETTIEQTGSGSKAL